MTSPTKKSIPKFPQFFLS